MIKGGWTFDTASILFGSQHDYQCDRICFLSLIGGSYNKSLEELGGGMNVALLTDSQVRYVRSIASEGRYLSRWSSGFHAHMSLAQLLHESGGYVWGVNPLTEQVADWVRETVHRTEVLETMRLKDFSDMLEARLVDFDGSIQAQTAVLQARLRGIQDEIAALELSCDSTPVPVPVVASASDAGDIDDVAPTLGQVSYPNAGKGVGAIETLGAEFDNLSVARPIDGSLADYWCALSEYVADKFINLLITAKNWSGFGFGSIENGVSNILFGAGAKTLFGLTAGSAAAAAFVAGSFVAMYGTNYANHLDVAISNLSANKSDLVRYFRESATSNGASVAIANLAMPDTVVLASYLSNPLAHSLAGVLTSGDGRVKYDVGTIAKVLSSLMIRYPHWLATSDELSELGYLPTAACSIATPKFAIHRYRQSAGGEIEVNFAEPSMSSAVDTTLNAADDDTWWWIDGGGQPVSIRFQVASGSNNSWFRIKYYSQPLPPPSDLNQLLTATEYNNSGVNFAQWTPDKTVVISGYGMAIGVPDHGLIDGGACYVRCYPAAFGGV